MAFDTSKPHTTAECFRHQQILLEVCSKLRALEKACDGGDTFDKDYAGLVLRNCQTQLCTVLKSVKESVADANFSSLRVNSETAYTLLGISKSSWKRYRERIHISKQKVNRHYMFSIFEIQQLVWDGLLLEPGKDREKALSRIQDYITRMKNYAIQNPQIIINNL